MNIKKLQHIIFRISIALKFIDGILEVFASLLLSIFTSQVIASIVQIIFAHELANDPNDFIANYLIQTSLNISNNAQLFAAIFLLIHGLIKIILSLGLWYEKVKFYPISAFVLTALIIYQTYRFTHTHSIILFLLTLIDILIVILIWVEYTRLKNKKEFA